MAFTDVYNPDYPAGNTPGNELDTAITQGVKRVFQERLNVDHDARPDEAGSETAQTPTGTVGYHKKATLIERSADPTQVANAGIIYTKDVSGVTELFYIDSSGNVIQLTSGGVSGFVPRSGDLLLSSNTNTPDGWTDVSTTYDNKFLRIGDDTPLTTTGGADTHDHGGATGSTTLTAAQSGLPAHTHIYYKAGVGSAYYGGSGGVHGNASTEANAAAAASEGHTHPIASANNVPVYIQCRMYKKD